MICPTCCGPIPAGLLLCEVCARVNGDRALRAYQYAPLRNVLARLGKLTLRRIEHRHHLQMFGAEKTYCGIKVSPAHRKGWLEYDPEKLTGICAACRDRLDRLIDEARRTA